MGKRPICAIKWLPKWFWKWSETGGWTLPVCRVAFWSYLQARLWCQRAASQTDRWQTASEWVTICSYDVTIMWTHVSVTLMDHRSKLPLHVLIKTSFKTLLSFWKKKTTTQFEYVKIACQTGMSCDGHTQVPVLGPVYPALHFTGLLTIETHKTIPLASQGTFLKS